MAKISVIVPVYNSMAYLKECLDSLLRQTFWDLEIILVDDGSTDSSAELCQRCAEMDGRVRFIRQEHAGVTRARQAGIRCATAEYVAFLDSDDWLESHAYERMYEVLSMEGSDLVVCDRYVSTGGHETLMCNSLEAGTYFGQRMRKEFWKGMIFNGPFFRWGIFPALWDKIFRLDMMRETLLAVAYEPSAIEDVGYSLTCMMKARRVTVLHEAFYHYRQHMGSLIKVRQEEYLSRYVAVAAFLCHQTGKLGLMDVMGPQLYDYFLFHMVPRLTDLLSGYRQQDFLIPFQGIARGSRVVVYGAGNYGYNLYRFLNDTSFCRPVGWLDREAGKYRALGWPVRFPSAVGELDYDYIAVAVVSEEAQRSICKNLQSLGCEAGKIKFIDMDFIRSEELRGRLRIPQEFRDAWLSKHVSN